jgi:flagellar hook-associated protein 2
MTSITAPAYDPTTTATAMAQKETSSAQELITNQTNTVAATAKGLSTLGSAISAFQTSLASLAGIGTSLLAQTAALSDPTIGRATAKPSAAAGTYNLFVDKLATAGQATYAAPEVDAPTTGMLNIAFAKPADYDPLATPPVPSTPAFQIDLAAANTDGDKDHLSAREIAAAINSSPDNKNLVSAGVATINGVTQLVLTSKNTGESNNVYLWSSTTPDALGIATPDYPLGAREEAVAGQDAEFHFGSRSSTAIKQPSNTFTGIDGVAFTATRAQAGSESMFSVTVDGDSSATTKNVQAFVDAYNKLKSAVDTAVDPGDPASTKGPGAFAHDAGVKALQSRLVGVLRTAGSPSLASYGIMAARDGTLTLDAARLTKQLAANPTGLDKLVGSASNTAPSGVAGALAKYLNQWSNSLTGQITQRSDANSKLQAALTKRQDEMQNKYDAAYQRYLKQFTALQALQSTMNGNVSMFDALFGNDKSN